LSSLTDIIKHSMIGGCGRSDRVLLVPWLTLALK